MTEYTEEAISQDGRQCPLSTWRLLDSLKVECWLRVREVPGFNPQYESVECDILAKHKH